MVETGNGGLPKAELSQERIIAVEKQYQRDPLRTIWYGGKAYLKFIDRGRREKPDKFEGFKNTYEGLSFADWMKRSDGAVNNYVKLLYDTTVSGKAIELAMENPEQADHGLPHIRRVEEWFEKAIFEDDEVRHSKLPFKFWLPAAYLAVRNHDVIQLLNGEKPYHAELAALFTLASYKQVAKAFDVSNELAFAYCQFAAKMILNHTSVEQTGANSAKEIFSFLGDDFTRLMDPVILKEFQPEFDRLRQDDRQLDINFKPAIGDKPATDNYQVFKKLDSLFGFADKFDALYPAELAALRSLMVSASKDRAFYVEPETLPGLTPISVEEQLKHYRVNKEWWKQSDVGRKLYELQRSLPETGNKYLKAVMDNNKLAAINSLKKLYTRLMAKDTQLVSDIFLNRREQIKAKIASRQKTAKLRDARMVMEKYGGALPSLDRQREKLMKMIEPKVRDYPEAQIDRVGRLFDRLYQLEVGAQKLSPKEAAAVEEIQPYGYYDSIAVKGDMQCNTLVSGKRIR